MSATLHHLPRFSIRPKTCSYPISRFYNPRQKNRTFVPNPFASVEPQTLSASRTLPYPSKAIYNVIADVPQYSSFLPFCLESTVTRWSRPDESGVKWPDEARLVVGWGNLQETFHSRIYCVPGKVVEAIGGKSKTTLNRDEIKHHTDTGSEDSVNTANGRTGLNQYRADLSHSHNPAANEGILTHLLTRWTVRPSPLSARAINSSPLQADVPKQELTEVSLAIEFQFANPLYNTMSAAATPKVAELMIKAFEERLAKLLDGTEHGSLMTKTGRL